MWSRAFRQAEAAYEEEDAARLKRLRADLLAPVNLLIGWFASAAGVLVAANEFSTSGSGGVFYPSFKTIGKRYRVLVTYTSSTATTFGVYDNSSAVAVNLLGQVSSATSGTIDVTSVAITTGIYLRASNAQGSVKITVSVKEVPL